MKLTSHQVAPDLEFQLASKLGDHLRGLAVGDLLTIAPSDDVFYSLELFLPQLLRSRYPEWKPESLDGFFVARAIKTGPNAARFAGTCILISDQTVTPFLLDLELSTKTDAVTAVHVRLGEPGGGRLGISGPPCNSKDARRLLETLLNRLDTVDWQYIVTRSAER